MSLSTDLFNYPLPSASIAQHPASRRDHSRLMVVHRGTRSVEHRTFYELPEILAAAQETAGKKIVFFRNNAKVIRARMFLKRKSGAEIEILLLRPSTDSDKWWCLAKPLKKIAVGEVLYAPGVSCSRGTGLGSRRPSAASLRSPAQGLRLGETTFQEKEGVESVPVAILKEKSATGEALFEFFEDPLVLSEKIGVLPLPPYIARKPHDANEVEDRERYQTVYAKDPVAAAAPTAGLHFTPELISKLERQGHCFADLTLHVGLDTFRPIATETVEEHKIHTETYEVSSEAEKLLKGKEFKLAVGTTSLRTMEDFCRKNFPEGNIHSASLFVFPPQKIISADALITNFHLPKSTLMCLVSAFLTPGSEEGIAWLKELYVEALNKGYRFYSYGDAMVVL